MLKTGSAANWYVRMRAKFPDAMTTGYAVVTDVGVNWQMGYNQGISAAKFQAQPGVGGSMISTVDMETTKYHDFNLSRYAGSSMFSVDSEAPIVANTHVGTSGGLMFALSNGTPAAIKRMWVDMILIAVPRADV